MASPTARAFERLCHEAAECTLCPRMAHKRAVLGPLNGTLTPRVLFIGEAPGRRGADRTRRPFTGDQSAVRFDALLASIGLTRQEIFITNAVLCCPADERRNRTPTVTEIAACRPFLARVLDLLAPPVVATVGAIALRALGDLVGARFSLADQAGKIVRVECGRFTTSYAASHNGHARYRFDLVPLYHVSPRVLHSVRSFEQQRQDFAAIARALRRQCRLTKPE